MSDCCIGVIPTILEQLNKTKSFVGLGERRLYSMKYAMCPKCGRRLCKGENGTKVEMECPKCGEFASVIIEEDDIHISKKPIFAPTDVSAKLKQHA
jgi:phage FluMu protein Com